MNRGSQHYDMVAIARRVLLENGFEPDMPAGIDQTIPAKDPIEDAVDLRALPWSSIDNEDSRDLDQIEYVEQLANNAVRVLIGIADVDAFVPKGSPVDKYAFANTQTLYTGVHIFPMLPLQLSVDRTSLLNDVDRLAVITEFVVFEDGTLDDKATKIYRAHVRNKAKLVYERVGAWIEGKGDPPTGGDVMAAQVRLQDQVAQRLRTHRHEHGALDFETIEANPVTKDGEVVDLVVQQKNRARELIEDLMIASNGATARYLEQHGLSSVRRIVRVPKRWDRIVELAATMKCTLPAQPDAKALSAFLDERHKAEPEKFADLSLSIVKLIGPGEYALQRATEPDIGHFGLAVDDYAHSTAPNRRYPDLITQRLLKACAAKQPPPYTDQELIGVAQHCTDRENSARKVERTMRKVAAALMLHNRIGEVFDAIVTGVSDKGVFARLIPLPAEGRIVSNEQNLDVGDKIKVRLTDTEPNRGFIDLVRV